MRGSSDMRADLMIPDVRLDPVPQLARIAHIPQVEKANLDMQQDFRQHCRQQAGFHALNGTPEHV